MIGFLRSAVAGRGLLLTVAAGVLAVLGAVALLLALRDGGEARRYGVEAALAEAAPDPAERWRRSFVGAVDGTHALIGLAVEPSGRVVAYVCDGDPDDLLSARRFGEWFAGGLDGGTARLTATAHPGAGTAIPVVQGTVKFIHAERTADGFAGTAIVDGSSHGFTAAPAAAPAGLYREVVVEGANGIDIGWVRREDGTITGHARRLTGGFSDVSGRRLS
jgi:hypothetical protein